MSDQKQTKFEEDLQAFFPEIYKLHTYSKFDKHFWVMWEAMLEMYDSSQTGQVVISFKTGKLDAVERHVDLLHKRKGVLGHNIPGKAV